MQRDGKIRLAQGRVVLIKINYLSLTVSHSTTWALPDQQAAALLFPAIKYLCFRVEIAGERRRIKLKANNKFTALEVDGRVRRSTG